MLHLGATWLLSYGLHSIAACALAIGVVRVVGMNAASRCVIWRVALFLPLLTASIAVAASKSGFRDRATVNVTDPVRRHLPSRWASQKVEVIVTAVNGRPDRRITEVVDPLGSAVSVGLVLIAVVSCAAGIGARSVRTSPMRQALRSRNVSANPQPIPARWGITITESDRIEVPIALRGREICIPTRSFAAMDDAARMSVMLHEVAHVERHDPYWMDASRLVSAMTWWQPLNRLVCARLELDTESAADERAVALGARPQSLVAGLAHFAGLIDAGFAGSGAALLHRDSPLVTRARLLLDRRATEVHPIARHVLPITLLALAAVLVTLPVPTTAAAAPGQPDQAAGSPSTRVVEEEREITILKNDRQP